MFWKWFWKASAILLILAVFVGGGIAIYRAAYVNGVTAAIWEAGEGVELPSQLFVPRADLSFRSFARYRLFNPGLGWFFGFLLVLFIFGGLGRLIRCNVWRSEGMPYPPHWGPGWHKYHHPHVDGEGPNQGKSPQGDGYEDGVGSRG